MASNFRMQIAANYIPVICKNEGVFQYSVTFNPSVDSRSMRGRMLSEHADTIGGVKAFDGAILFLPIRLQQQVSKLFKKTHLI